MADSPLIERLKVLAAEEKKIKEYRRRLRLKGKIVNKGTTQKGNITLTVQKDADDYKFTVLKSHKERYALAEKDLKNIPRPYYKHVSLIKKMFDPQRKLKEFIENE